MGPLKNFDSYVRQRQGIRTRVDIEHGIVDLFVAATPKQTLDRAEREMLKLQAGLEELNSNIISLCDTDEEIEDHTKCFMEIQKTFGIILDKLAILKPDPQPQPADPNAGTAHYEIARLPKLDLPKFNGKYEEWMSFKDLFTAAVIDNPKLSQATQLMHLKGCVEGPAAILIKDYNCTNANFQVAWDALERRYEFLRDIKQKLIKKLLNQNCVTHESASGIRTLLDNTNSCISSLKALNVPVDQWGDILVVIVTEKLDKETRSDWAKQLMGTDMPSFESLVLFLETQIRALELAGKGKGFSEDKEQKKAAAHFASPQLICPACSDPHPFWSCKIFEAKTAAERVKLAQSKKLCLNCLKSQCNARLAKDCRSKGCRICHKKHNSMLHFEKAGGMVKVSAQVQEKLTQPPEVLAAGQAPSAPHMATHTAPTVVTHHVGLSSVLLCTAVVKVKDKWGSVQFCRVFLDQGSQTSFITEACRFRLGIKREKSWISDIVGMQGISVGKPQGQVNVTLGSCHNGFEVNVVCLVLPKVTGQLPNFKFEKMDWEHLRGLDLADPHYNQPNEVDILLGADVYNHIILDDKRMGPALTPTAQASEFGWILSGCLSNSFLTGLTTVNCHVMAQSDDIVKKFWEMEEVPHHPQITKHEKQVEDHFNQTHTRNLEGRFIVAVPYNGKLDELGASRAMALKRFYHLERRLTRLPDRRVEYCKFMREYEDLGHMSMIPANECGERIGTTNYLPHHFVLKEESTTTKMRVVFDASAKTVSGVSLNDCLMVGPTIQDDIFAILLRFRLNPIALKADAAKMYRQFLVTQSDQDRQRIFWRESEEQPVKEYRLNTVTYGTASAPFLATRCLQQLTIDHAAELPNGAAAAARDVYVDDFLGGAKSPEEASLLVYELRQLMGRGGMEFRKWDSNDKSVLTQLDPHLKETNGAIPMDTNTTSKALGVTWDSGKDLMCFSGHTPRKPKMFTKRTLLSELSRIFDPLGWLSPLTILVKVFFQKLWKPVELGSGENRLLGWDDPIPETLLGTWDEHFEGLSILSQITLERCVFQAGIERYEIHGFSDASEDAYAAVLYVRCFHFNGIITTHLLAGKTRVAPLKHVSIPRLELCGAMLLAKLTSAVITAAKFTCPIYAWTDSELVLRWISSSSRRWATFVANRVSEIQDIIPSEFWRFIPGKENPADCASRGLIARELKDFKLWWEGPPWLCLSTLPTFQLEGKHFGDELEEKRKVILTHTTVINITWRSLLLSKYESLSKLKHVISYCWRFLSNCRKTKVNRQLGPIQGSEIQESWLICLKWAQTDSFSRELGRLSQKRPVHKDSRIASLNPFLDENGVIRVGGRLQNAKIPKEMKHQIILDGTKPLTHLLIRHTHLVNFHAGFQLLTNTLQREYWILKARSNVKLIIRKCVDCRRHRGETALQLMGNLPAPRVQPSRPFSHTGVDYAGPFTLQAIRGRGKLQFNGHFSVFVCLSTKAVHLEAVTELTSVGFIPTLKRFIARRGIPSDMYADRGTNFTRADKDMKEFGGLWEAAVKSAKFHIKRVVGTTTLTLEEFWTILCQVEAILNSRPLCPLSSDPEDYNVLTPGHFLIGQPLNAIPEPGLTHINPGRLSRWQHTTQMMQHFWERWSQEYLAAQQERTKWKRQADNIKLGDLIIIKEDNLPIMKWSRGRVIKLHPGADGLVRVVTIKTSTAVIQRPVVKCVVLLSPDDN